MHPNQHKPATTDEDLFIDILQEAVGFLGVQSLQFQHRITDHDGRSRDIDYALQTPFANYAFEVDGEYFHVFPNLYRETIVKQNALIHQGWKVYRWTDHQLRTERDRIVEQLRLFLERELTTGALEKSDLLPLQEGATLELRDHQSEALAALDELRAAGKTIALLTHATGAGKTVVAVTDARRCNLRTLYLAHTVKLPQQTAAAFRSLWPEVAGSVAIFKKGNHQGNPEVEQPQVVLATLQSVARNLSLFDPREFGYIIVDEAHHAAAESFSKVIQYFQPRFLLGLTATPDRSDDKSLLQIFRETAHRLTLEEAIQRGILVPIRCLRVETNIDLRRVRYNGVDYRLKDLEQAIQVPGRDDLIVDVYLRHAPGRRAVCFCVNVDHAERMTAVFRSRGIHAATVSGRLPVAERDAILAAYEAGTDLQVLCACDILNEGWDSPRTEVLLMARPTLSKVLYVQQLGRGTRAAPGKQHLLVFDFVDQADRHAQALSVHRIFQKPSYRPGALVAAPADQMESEARRFETAGQQSLPQVILGMNIFETSLQPVDIFRWQDEAAGMMAASELARELRVDDDTVRQRVRRGELKPDLSVPAGSRELHFFHRDRVPELQAQYGVQPLTDENIRDQFLRYVETGDLSSSYKPVLLLAMLQCTDKAGRARIQDLVAFFRNFYLERAAAGLPVESPTVRMSRVAEMTDLDIERTMLAMPFEKFERKGFFRRLKDLAFVRFSESLWRALKQEDATRIRNLTNNQLQSYFQRIAPTQ